MKGFDCMEGALPGVFSVGPGERVRFSRGNLQYQASTDRWRFAERQWDIIGRGCGETYEELGCIIGGTVAHSNNEMNGIQGYAGWIDLFGWGTGDNPTKRSYNNRDYSSFTDWGVNPIINGGNTPDHWRTLTNKEWRYLFEERPDAISKKGVARINGVPGEVILPDEWILPAGCSFTAGYPEDDWDWFDEAVNEYSKDQWNAMEANGAVFLPVAGIYYGAVVGVGSYGYYWSSTPVASYNAFYVSFCPAILDPKYYCERNDRLSVRLVTEI